LRIIRGYEIPEAGRQGTPEHIGDVDLSYIRETTDAFILQAPQNIRAIEEVDYTKRYKAVEKERFNNPYTQRKDSEIDYRFWNAFHENFYRSVIFNSRRSKICKMRYIQWDKVKAQKKPEMNMAEQICRRFEMKDIMAFRYDWNTEVLAQFHATFFWEKDSDYIH